MKTLSYEMCKKLKEAGFPQDYHDCVGDSEGNCVCCDDRWEKDVMKPTLEELVDALGSDLQTILYKDTGTWHAIGNKTISVNGREEKMGDTLSKALAGLWLKLN